jgi:hypothetical protein
MPRQIGSNEPGATREHSGIKEGRADRHAAPAVFWHSYDHPECRPDPDGATALGATVAAFPSWDWASAAAWSWEGAQICA